MFLPRHKPMMPPEAYPDALTARQIKRLDRRMAQKLETIPSLMGHYRDREGDLWYLNDAGVWTDPRHASHPASHTPALGLFSPWVPASLLNPVTLCAVCGDPVAIEWIADDYRYTCSKRHFATNAAATNYLVETVVLERLRLDDATSLFISEDGVTDVDLMWAGLTLEDIQKIIALLLELHFNEAGDLHFSWVGDTSAQDS